MQNVHKCSVQILQHEDSFGASFPYLVEASNAINGPKCNKGPKCNTRLVLNVIKVLNVINFGPKCNKPLRPYIEASNQEPINRSPYLHEFLESTLSRVALFLERWPA